jgi:hypothetical protein
MNTSENKTDCGCNTGCCEPKKSGLWKKIVFGIIILFAAFVIFIKLSGSNEGKAKCSSKDSTECAANSAKCDTSKHCCEDK